MLSLSLWLKYCVKVFCVFTEAQIHDRLIQLLDPSYPSTETPDRLCLKGF